MMTYPLVGKKLYETADMKLGDLELINSLSEDAASMRPSLIPSVLNHAQLNQKSYEDFRFFEIGKVYLDDEKSYSTEENHLVVGKYSKGKRSKFVELLINRKVINQFKPPLPIDFVRTPKFPSPVVFLHHGKGIHPVERYDVKIMGRVLGSIFTIHPLMLRNVLRSKGTYPCFFLV